jgi:hypothetical protein
MVTNHFRKAGVPEEHYIVYDGRLAPPGTKPVRSNRTQTDDAYEVVIDQRSATATGKVNILFRRANPSGQAANPWTLRSLTVGVQAQALTRLAQIGPGMIAGTTGGYGAMFTYDIARNSTRVLGFPAGMNPYSIAWIDGKAYVSGYPSTQFAVADLNRPFTHSEATADGPGIPWEDARANPRLIASLGTVLEGSHTGIGVFPGADGRIYIVGQRHRHYRGFGVAYYDRKTGKFGEVDSGGMTQQTQISWVTPIDNGQRLAISTRVQPDDNKSAPPPNDARLFILDTRTGKFTHQISPLPGVQALGPIAESEGCLIGTAANPANAESGPSTLYKFDLRAGRTVLTRTYQGLICGVSANHDAPSKSYDFMTGPDGKIWTMFLLPFADSDDLLIRIRPSDLGIETLGTLKGEVRFLFVGNDLYLTGSRALRRLRNATSMR